MKEFNVIIWDINRGKFIPYDIMPYLRKVYSEARVKPKTLNEFIRFVDDEAKYQWWARCEYEIIITGWPQQKREVKVDIWSQIEMNIDVIVGILMDEFNSGKKIK